MRHRFAEVLFVLALAPFAFAQETAKPAAEASAQVASAQVAAKPAGLTKETVEAIADRAFAAFAPKGMALAVVLDGKLLVELARGERKDGEAVTPRSLFNIASCSKAFTATLVAQQVAAGKLHWDDRVIDHVPEFRMADPWITSHMTIVDLLSHRCGLATFAGDLLWYGTEATDAEVLARLEKLPITQAFRDEFGYQNLMYMVAGLVLERTTGRTWEQLVEERILQPLAMSDSRASAQRLPENAERAWPHIDGYLCEDHVFFACKPAASIQSSVHDLSSWIRALLAGGTLGEAEIVATPFLHETWQPRTSMRRGGGDVRDHHAYGMGWFLNWEGGRKIVEHDGGMPGYLSKVSLLPEANFGFTVLNNANDGILNEAIKAALYAAQRGEDGLAQIERFAKIDARVKARTKAQNEKREAARVPDTKPTLALEAYAGIYEDAIYGRAEVKLEGEQLHVVLLPARKRMFGAMAHWHHDTFRVDFPDRFLPFALCRFELGVDGAVAGFRIDCPIADFDFGALDFRRVAAKK